MKKYIDFNKTHPEILPNERFHSNCTTDEYFNSLKYSHKRKGINSYTNNGILMDFDNYFPIFVSGEEGDIRNNKVFAFEFCSDINESNFAVISLHYSKEGAENAMKTHKQKELDDFNRIKFPTEYNITFGIHQDWRVIEYEILD